MQHRQNTKEFIADKREEEVNKDTRLQTSFTKYHQKVFKTVGELMPNSREPETRFCPIKELLMPGGILLGRGDRMGIMLELGEMKDLRKKQ